MEVAEKKIHEYSYMAHEYPEKIHVNIHEYSSMDFLSTLINTSSRRESMSCSAGKNNVVSLIIHDFFDGKSRTRYI